MGINSTLNSNFFLDYCNYELHVYVIVEILLVYVCCTIQRVFNQDPVVQSIVSLTISLRHKFVKQILAKVTNTLLFFVEKM